MVMLRPKGKAEKVATAVLRKKNIKVAKSTSKKDTKPGPALLH